MRKSAKTFQEVEETEVEGTLTYTVRGTEFASITKKGVVHLLLPEADVEQVVAEYPRAERLTEGGKTVGCTVPVADVNGQRLWMLVMAAWRHHAPTPLAERLNAILENPQLPGSDLPTSIGTPAMRALAIAGVTTLDDVASRTEAELQALHGMGPKAVRILADTLAEKGMSMR